MTYHANQITNNIIICSENDNVLPLFSKICKRLNQKSRDKMTQIPALFWKNTYKGTISWSWENMKCRWAVLEKTGNDFMCVLSGRRPAKGVHEKLFKALKKVDKNVIVLNNFHDTENKYLGTRILYHEHDIEEVVPQKDINLNKNDESYEKTNTKLKNQATLRAMKILNTYRELDEKEFEDDSEI